MIMNSKKSWQWIRSKGRLRRSGHGEIKGRWEVGDSSSGIMQTRLSQEVPRTGC